MNLLVCDLDGTMIADSNYGPGELDESLPPNHALLSLLQAVAASGEWHVAIVTSRSESHQQKTVGFLAANLNIDCDIIMRSDGDWQIAPDFKVAEIAKLIAKYNPEHIVAIDSRDDVCAAYREQGYTVLEPFK